MFSDKRRGDIWWMSDTHRKPADTCLIRGRPTGDRGQQRQRQPDRQHGDGGSHDLQPRKAGPGRRILRQRPSSGYGEPSMALPRQVHGADRADLQQYLGHLTDADMRRLDAALRSALGL